MPEVFNVLMVGVGGQGIVLASDVLAQAALRAGLDVKKSEIHGMSQRGGPVFSHVRFGAGVVHSPTIPQGEADVVYALERMELMRWAAWARPGATACYVDHDILPLGVSSYPADLDEEISHTFGALVRFDPREVRRVLSPKVVNSAVLGAVSVAAPLAEEHYLAALDELCPPGTAEVNRAGFAYGAGLAREQLAAAARG